MLRGAFLGAGNIARAGHLPAYLAQSSDRHCLRIVAAADPCPENLALLAGTLPDVRPYCDAETLLEREQPDFVDICAPPFAHAALLELAVARGIHVLCEKPLTTNLCEALTLRDRVAAAPVVVMPCHQYHYAPPWQALRQVLRSGEIGPVGSGVVTVERTGANAGSTAWRPSWRTEPALAGGGILVDHGAHLFYQLIELFGEPESIACVVEQRLPDCCVDDTVMVELRFATTAVRLLLTWAAQVRASGHSYFGALGTARLLDDRIEIEAVGGARTIRFGSGLSAGSAHSDWFTPLLEQFRTRIATHDYRLDRFDEAVSVAACITLAYESARDCGRPVSWRLLPSAELAGSFAAD